MAFPTVEATNNSTTTSAGTSHTVNLPTGIVSGNLLLVFFAESIGTGGTVSFPGGWTALTEGDNDTQAGGRIAYRIADATEGTTITVTTGASTKAAHVSYRIANWHGTTAPEQGTWVAAATQAIDPPSLTPSWGAADTLWIEVACVGGNTTITAPSTNYATAITAGTSGGAAGTNARVGTYRRTVNTATEDPDNAFSHSSAQNWVANTLAIRPVAGGLTNQSLDAVAVGVAVLTKVNIWARTLAVVAVGVSALTTLTTYLRTLAAVSVGVTTLTKLITTANTTLATVTVGVVTLAKNLVFIRTMDTVAIGVTTLTTQNIWARTLAVVNSGVVSLTTLSTYFRTFDPVAVGVVTLTTVSTYLRTLAASAVGAVTLTTGLVFSRALDAVAVGVAALTKVLSFPVTLGATAVGVVTLDKVATYLLTLAASAVGVAALTRGVLYNLTLAVIAVGVAGLTRVATYLRTLAAVAVGVVSLAGALAFNLTLAAIALGVAVLDAVTSGIKTLAAVAVGVAGLTVEYISGAGESAATALNVIVQFVRHRRH